jgi:N-acetylglucosaminyl-diphospho-decaprenol L-rhamnosyltransferase
MSLTVGILAHDSEQVLPDLLESVPDALAGVDGWHLVVVDGASTDGTVELVRRTAPNATCVDLGGNRGFAAAANAAIAAFPAADAVLILSPRVRLTPGCVKVMLDALREPGTGIVVPRLFRGPGQPYPSLRRRPTLLRAFAEALLGGRLTRPIGAFSELIADPAGYSSGTRADWATGAVTMMSRECVTRAGPWDESFFLYSEETEFELRAADAGFRLGFADVDVIHLGGESRVRPELWSLLCANRVRLYGMRHGRAPATLFWAAILLGESLRSARAPIHRAAVRKLLRERAAIVAGRPARPPALGH